MSEETASFTTETREVFVRLTGEGTDVCRPTRASPRGGMQFELLATEDYDPDDEQWEFPPGSVVVCSSRDVCGRHILMATSLVGSERHTIAPG